MVEVNAKGQEIEKDGFCTAYPVLRGSQTVPYEEECEPDCS